MRNLMIGFLVVLAMSCGTSPSQQSANVDASKVQVQSASMNACGTEEILLYDVLDRCQPTETEEGYDCYREYYNCPTLDTSFVVTVIQEQQEPIQLAEDVADLLRQACHLLVGPVFWSESASSAIFRYCSESEARCGAYGVREIPELPGKMFVVDLSGPIGANYADSKELEMSLIRGILASVRLKSSDAK